MSTEVSVFDPIALPAYMQEGIASGEIETTLQQRQNMPQLTFRGKVWRAIVKGEEHVQTNQDGDPISTIKVVILATNTARSRAYYEGQYKEGENRMPTCWSNDGTAPDADVERPCGEACASCPMAAKGSRVNIDGSAGVACSTFKNIVVVPANDLNFPALRLRLPQTSIWDKSSDDKHWFAYDQYIDMLRSRGTPNQSLVVTKIKFDPSKAYPKLLFSLDTDHHPKYGALLTEEEYRVVARRTKEDFGVLLGTKKMDGTPRIALTPVPVLDKEKPKPAPAPAPQVAEEKVVEMPKKAKKEEPVEVKAEGTNDKLGALLDDWDDE